MDPNHDQMLREIYRMTQENNRMLRTMRRNAFVHGIFRWIFWLVIIVASYWSYITYIQPMIPLLIKSLNQLQAIQGQTSSQLGDLQKVLQNLQGKLPGSQ